MKLTAIIAAALVLLAMSGVADAHITGYWHHYCEWDQYGNWACGPWHY